MKISMDSARVGFFACAMVFACASHARPGDRDPTYGQGGRTVVSNLQTGVRLQANRFIQQVVKIERIRFDQPVLIPLEDDGEARHPRIGGVLVEVRGVCFMFFAWLMRDSAARYCMNFSSRPRLR